MIRQATKNIIGVRLINGHSWDRLQLLIKKIAISFDLIAAFSKLLPILRGKTEKFLRETIDIPDVDSLADFFPQSHC